MWTPAPMPSSPIRYDALLARSLPQLARLWVESFRLPCAPFFDAP